MAAIDFDECGRRVHDAPDEDLELAEATHFTDVLFHFMCYHDWSLKRMRDNRWSHIGRIGPKYRAMIPDMEAKVAETARCLRINEEFIKNVLKCSPAFMGSETIVGEKREFFDLHSSSLGFRIMMHC